MHVSCLLALLLSITSTAARTVMIGNSMFAGVGEEGNGGSRVQEDLEDYAGHPIENKAIVGSSLHEGWTKSIPSQYADLDKSPVPTTILMDGGGNDVISKRQDCEAFNDHCRAQITEAVHIGADLLAQMHTDGVAHVIWMGFFYIPGLEQAVNFGTDVIRKICHEAKIDCHVADLRDLEIPRGWDGIHPTSPEGYQLLADRIWEVKLAHDLPL